MAAPVITSITPASGPTAGGTTVTIVGTGLDTATSVAFGATPAADFAALSATLLVAISPAGSGAVDVTVTNGDGTSDAAGFTFADALFTIAEARSYPYRNALLLADDSVYPDATITAAEAAIRELFERACGVAFVPTTVTEVLDGNHTRVLDVAKRNPCLESPQRPLTVTAASIDGTPLNAGELAAVKAHPDGRLVRTDGATWSSSTGYQDLAVSVTYTHGWSTVPDLIKDAALRLLCVMLIGSDTPDSAISFSDGGASYQFARPGRAPHWTGVDYVDSRLAMFAENTVVVA